MRLIILDIKSLTGSKVGLQGDQRKLPYVSYLENLLSEGT